MTQDINQNPEQKARDKIDQMLRDAGCLAQDGYLDELATGLN